MELSKLRYLHATMANELIRLNQPLAAHQRVLGSPVGYETRFALESVDAGFVRRGRTELTAFPAAEF